MLQFVFASHNYDAQCFRICHARLGVPIVRPFIGDALATFVLGSEHRVILRMIKGVLFRAKLMVKRVVDVYVAAVTTDARIIGHGTVGGVSSSVFRVDPVASQFGCKKRILD